MLFILGNLSSSSHPSTRSRGGDKRWLSSTVKRDVKISQTTMLEVRMKNISRTQPSVVASSVVVIYLCLLPPTTI